MKFDILLEHLLLEYSNGGEYWIDDSGGIQYADGDIGDYNHESIIMMREVGVVCGVFNVDFDDETPTEMRYVDLKRLRRIFDALNDAGYIKDGTADEITDASDIEEPLIKYLHDNNPYKSADQLEEALEVVGLKNGKTDARDYGMKWLGYVRVKNNDVQTWYLRSEDMRNIASGLSSILEDRGAYDDDEADEEKFNIEVVASGKYYQDVPMSVIDECDVMKIALYENKLESGNLI
jgi:hypothetical protein